MGIYRFSKMLGKLSLITVFLASCSETEESKKPSFSPPSESDEALVFSEVIRYEDTSLAFEKKYKWKPISGKIPKFRYLFDFTPIDSQIVSAGSQVFISIYDRYRTPPFVDVPRLLDSAASQDAVDQELIDRFINNRDTSMVSVKINGRHKYLFFNEELSKKPNFTIERLPKNMSANTAK